MNDIELQTEGRKLWDSQWDSDDREKIMKEIGAGSPTASQFINKSYDQLPSFIQDNLHTWIVLNFKLEYEGS